MFRDHMSARFFISVREGGKSILINGMVAFPECNQHQRFYFRIVKRFEWNEGWFINPDISDFKQNLSAQTHTKGDDYLQVLGRGEEGPCDIQRPMR